MRWRLFTCHMQAVADPKGWGASSQEEEYLQEPLRCVGIHEERRGTACKAAANELLIFPQPLAIYTLLSGNHSKLVYQSGVDGSSIV